MRRRLFLLNSTSSALAAALAGCGGGGSDSAATSGASSSGSSAAATGTVALPVSAAVDPAITTPASAGADAAVTTPVSNATSTPSPSNDATSASSANNAPTQSSAASGSGYAFGTRKDAYAAGILPKDTNTNFDNFIKSQYDYWLSGVLAHTTKAIGSIPAGAYWPQFSDTNYACVSEGMGYGMLIAVVMAGYDVAAKTKFDGMFALVKAFPCTGAGSLGEPNLMDWRVSAAGYSAGGGYPALDGELDIALALLMADRQWGSSGSYNYKSEALTRIAAMKAHCFNTSGIITSSITGRAGRSSDYMFGHFRAFKAATTDTFWDNVISQQLRIANYIQNNYSAATGLIPDWITDVATSTPRPPVVATDSYVGDYGNNNQGDYWYNACRDPWRFAADYVLSGDSSVKTLLTRMETFFKTDSGGAVLGLVAGYHLDGTHAAAAGTGFITPEFQAPIMAGAMCDATHQSWLDANWSWVKAHPATGYYGTEIQLMCAIIASGNWWKP